MQQPDAARPQALIAGAGVAGLTCAVRLAECGVDVLVRERAAQLGRGSCAWYAGGMLAPWCELEADGEPLIAALGSEGLAWWRARLPGIAVGGTLVVAGPRDRPELARFAARTRGFRWLDRAGIAALEPDLAGRFEQALYFEEEAHLDPRRTLAWLAGRLQQLGGRLQLDSEVSDAQLDAAEAAHPYRWRIDCRGLGARTALPQLRGVRGEMLQLQTDEITLRRPVRLLHPRWPLYVVPRGEGVYMIGATMLESDATGAVTARSALELLGAAYALHPAFGEARVLELGAQARPAFADNLPRIEQRERLLRVNGLYRHGFLIAPALAARVTTLLTQKQTGVEGSHEDHVQRQLA